MSDDFRIGDYVVRPSRSLIEGPGGGTRVKPKSMAVLCKLADSAGKVISRNELFDSVWPHGDVSDDVLTHSIVELRKALGDSAKDPIYIETVPRKGVRLMADVKRDVVERPKSERQGRPRWSLVAILAVIATLAIIVPVSQMGENGPAGNGHHKGDLQEAYTEPKAIAVLPFVDMSPAGDREFIADGLTEELINRLTQINGLLVTGRTSSFFFKGRNEDLREIGRQLSVQYILEGSVRFLDTDMRVTAQLIDVDSGFHMWSRVFDAQSEDIFEIQSEISESVADALSVELGLSPHAAQQGSTTQYEAYEALMRGDSYFNRYTIDNLNRALDAYNEAVRIDPQYAIAWTRIAQVHMYWYLVAGRSDLAERQPLADEALDRARDIAPDAVSVLLTSADNEAGKLNWSGALAYIDRASEVTGWDMRLTGVYADIGVKLGFPGEVIELWNRLRRIEPLVTTNYSLIAHTLILAREYDAASDHLERGWSSNDKHYAIANEGITLALTLDDPDLIRLWLERALEYVPPNGFDFYTSMLATLGDRDAAITQLRHWYGQGMDYDYFVALWAAYYGETDLVLDSMRRSQDLWVFWLDLLREARATDEFKSILNETGVVDAMREFGWNEFCEPAGRSDFICR